jgi:REP-associated tyrosine transposase
MRICGFCLMPNHWHLVLWPEADGDLARFMQRVTNTHVQRWQRHRRRVGEGHVYQGRYKSFPVQEDDHFYQLMRYVERNALRANLVERAEEWRWSSLATCKSDHPDETWPIAWPVRRPRGWVEYVNRVETEAELAAIRGSLKRGRPLGHASWVEEAASRLGLQSTLRDRGRPRKVSS